MGSPEEQQPVLAELFADHVLNTKYTDLTQDAIVQAKVFILDTFGVGIAGSSAFGANIIIEASSKWAHVVGTENDGARIKGNTEGIQAGGRGGVRLWGRPDIVPAGIAAMINAFQVHCQEYDCVHEEAVMHPLATLLPAVMAYTDSRNDNNNNNNQRISGRDLITACAVGVNISAGLGIASRSPMRFFRPATAGGFGAVAAVGRLMGFDRDTLVRAFGMQYAQTSGTLQAHVEGSPALPLQVGLNSRAALQSCDLALAGLPGTRECFEGTYGYFQLIEGPERWDLRGMMDAVQGRRWLIAEISHKPYPAGRATHGGVEGILALMKQRNEQGEKGKGTVKAEDIESITITGPPVTARLCGRPDKPDPQPNYARLCMAYIGAKTVLNNRPVDLADYRGEALSDPATHEMAKRIRMISDGSNDPAALVPVSVEMKVRGEEEARKWKCEQMLASPTRRLTRQQHLAKFRRCWEFSAVKLPTRNRERLIELVEQLEDVEDVKDLTALLVPPAHVARL